MHTTALIGISCFLWYSATFAANFKVAPSAAGLSYILTLVCLLPMALGRWVNSYLCKGELRLATVLLRNAALFLPYSLLTVWSVYGLYPAWIGAKPAAIYHTAGQVLFWLLGLLAVYLTREQLETLPTQVFVAIAAPAILLLAGTGASSGVVVLCIVVWYYSLVFALAAKVGTPVRNSTLVLHSLVPLAAVTVMVYVVFSGSLDVMFAQIKQLLLSLWQLLLMLLRLMDTPPDNNALKENQNKALQDAIEMARNHEPVNTWPIIVLAACFVIAVLIMLVRLIIGLLNLRLSQRATTATRHKGARPGAALLAAFKALSGFLRNLICGTLAATRAIARLLARFSRWFKNWLTGVLPPKTPAQSVLRSYRGLLLWGHLLHLHRARAETPLEYLQRIQAAEVRRQIPLAEAQALTMRFVEVQYGGLVPDWQTAAECRQLLKKIRRSRLTSVAQAEKTSAEEAEQL